MEPTYELTISDPKYYAQRLMPYLGRPLSIMEAIPAEGLGTFAVDKHWRMYFDPSLLNTWTLDELSAVVLHECFHLIFDHASRFASLHEDPTDRQAMIWNVAADMAINSILHYEPDVTLPDGCVYPWKMPGQNQIDYESGLSAEEYYDLLSNEPDSLIDDTFGTGRPQDCPFELGHGSGVDNFEREWEFGPPDDAGGIDEVTQRRIRRAAIQELREAKERGHFKGSESGEVSSVITRILEPKIDPAAEIFASVKYAVNSIHGYGSKTFKRRNPRQPAGTLLMPANEQPIPQVRVLIDTSGSMDDDTDLALAAGVVAKVINALPGEGVQVYCADTEVKSVQKVFSATNINADGRGGTAMEVAIPQVDQDEPRPDVIICITDGGTEWPEKETKSKLIVCLTRPPSSYYPPPKWCKVICISKDSE